MNEPIPVDSDSNPSSNGVLSRDISEDEELVIWACLWANVRDVHSAVYRLDSDQLKLGTALFRELDARLNDLNADEREIMFALMHGILEEECDPHVDDFARADSLCGLFDRIINLRVAPDLELPQDHGHAL